MDALEDSESDEEPKLGKRGRKGGVSLNYEYEFEEEKPNKRKVSEAKSIKSKSTRNDSVDF
jgi:hypothetical protein